MSVCGNCGTKLSCGCQKRTASDKKPCCSNCIGPYEKALKNDPATKRYVWDIGKRR